MADAKALFDVISIMDIIKNEELYTRKIQELKDEYAKLQDATFIAKTVEQASRVLEEAKKKYEENERILSNAKNEASKIIEEAKANAEKQYDKAKKLKSIADDKQIKADKMVSEMQDRYEQLEKRAKELQEWDQYLMDMKKNLQSLETTYNSKMNAIKEIMNT